MREDLARRMRSVATVHGLTNEAATELEIHGKQTGPGARRKPPREDATSGERTLVACWFWHLAETNLNQVSPRNTPMNAKRVGH